MPHWHRRAPGGESTPHAGQRTKGWSSERGASSSGGSTGGANRSSLPGWTSGSGAAGSIAPKRSPVAERAAPWLPARALEPLEAGQESHRATAREAGRVRSCAHSRMREISSRRVTASGTVSEIACARWASAS